MLRHACAVVEQFYSSPSLSFSLRYGAGQDPPVVRQVNASYEIDAFSKTLEALYRIVRSANIAFFAGELDFAYRVLVDALRLFRRLDNKKAVGIASNNIGNILLGIYREMQSANLDRLYGLSRSDVVSQGILHFHNAIRLGEKAYDEFYDLQGWTPSCLNFMQHLSNRYFNRGLFLLHVKNDHANPTEIETFGLRDIQIAGDMDQEVVAYSEEIGWASADLAEKRFNVSLVRIRGFIILYDLGFTNDWGVEHLVEETVDVIRTECKNNRSELFSTMSLAGRLQDLEIQLMKYYRIRGDVDTAAKIAVRMIIEDERILTEAMATAMDILIKYFDQGQVDAALRARLSPILLSYRTEVVDLIKERRQAARDDLDSMSASLPGSILQRGSSCSQITLSHLSTPGG